MNRRTFLTTALAGGIAGFPRLAIAQKPAPPHELGDITHPVSYFELGAGKQVFLDWWLIEAGYGLSSAPLAQQKELNYRPAFMPYGVKLATIPPTIQPEPIVRPDQPADGSVIGAYCTLMQEEGKYRLWYEGYDVLPGGEYVGRICYAESEDGKRWMKPNLGLVKWNGSKHNNIVYDYRLGHGATIFRDPFGPGLERYKLLHTGFCDEHRTASQDLPVGRGFSGWFAVDPPSLAAARARKRHAIGPGVR